MEELVVIDLLGPQGIGNGRASDCAKEPEVESLEVLGGESPVGSPSSYEAIKSSSVQPASRGGVYCGLLEGGKDDMGESCCSGKDNLDSPMSSDWFVFVSVDAGRGEGKPEGEPV